MLIHCTLAAQYRHVAIPADAQPSTLSCCFLRSRTITAGEPPPPWYAGQWPREVRFARMCVMARLLLHRQLGKEAGPSMVTLDLSQSIHNDRVMPPATRATGASPHLRYRPEPSRGPGASPRASWRTLVASALARDAVQHRGHHASCEAARV